jgi:hypothetical protein
VDEDVVDLVDIVVLSAARGVLLFCGSTFKIFVSLTFQSVKDTMLHAQNGCSRHILCPSGKEGKKDY